MPKTNVYDMSGKQVGEIELSAALFGIEPNQSVVHDVVKNHLANCRQQEALETEGHRPRPSGQHPGSPVDPRRHRVRSQAPGLQLHPQ